MVLTNTASEPLLRAAALTASSAFYSELRALLSDAAIAWETVPFTTSTDLLEHRADFRGTLPVSVYASSGTSSRAKTAYFSTGDHAATIGRTIASLVASGVRPTDTLVVAHGFGIWLIGADFARAGETLGLTVLPIGKGPGLVHTLDLIDEVGCDVLATSPSYAYRLLNAGLGEVPSRRPRLILLSGEAVTPVLRRFLVEASGADRVHSFYGSAEMGHLGVDPRGDGVIDVHLDFACELIDGDERLVTLEPEAIGELVLTTLFHRGMPLVRYRTGDLVRVADIAAAGDRARLSVEVLGRLEESVALEAGEKLWAWQIDHVVMAHPAITDFQAIVREVPVASQWLSTRDEVVVRVATRNDMPVTDADIAQLENALRSASIDISAVAGATADFRVEWMRGEELRDAATEGKRLRLVDQRATAAPQL